MNCDIAIIGGGLVGASLAIALQQTGRSVILVDARHPTKDDPRLFALSYGSCQFLQELELWSHLKAQATALTEVQVSRKHRFGSLYLRASECGLNVLGYTLPAQCVEKILNDKLASLSDFTLLRPASLTALHQDKEGVFLTVQTDEKEITIKSTLIIGADGADSSVRRLLNMAVKIIDYQQKAIVAKIKVSFKKPNIAYERFTREGVIAFLPEGQSNTMIWTVKTNQAENLLSLTDANFLHVLQKEFGWRLGRLEETGVRHVFPLRQIHTPQAVCGRALLLGNAAHTLHPVAAQGFNLALYEGKVLVNEIMRESKLSPGALQQTVSKSSTRRKLSMMMSHHLPGLCSTSFPLLDQTIQGAMMGLNILAPIKKMWLKQLVI